MVVHGIDRVTGDHLCGEKSGLGTDAINPGMEITCPLCALVLEAIPVEPPYEERNADRCRHCGRVPDPDGDHNCTCPHPDDTCPVHPRELQ